MCTIAKYVNLQQTMAKLSYVFSVNKQFGICSLRYPNIRIPKALIIYIYI